MARQKHRVIVEVTFDKRVTAKFAKNVVQYSLDMTDSRLLDSKRTSVIKMVAKEAERVIQAELRWRGRASTKGDSADRLEQSDGGPSGDVSS